MSLTGYEVVTNTDFSTLDQFSVFVACPSGKVVLGGGANCADSRGRLIESFPEVQNGTDVIGWTARISNSNTSTGGMSLNVYCLVADV